MSERVVYKSEIVYKSERISIARTKSLNEPDLDRTTISYAQLYLIAHISYSSHMNNL